ncbi:MAG: hypothetical protein Q8N04_07610 [Nitrospira sp.]|nr:hypothetical protein [Nitrospira sp.]
MTAVIRVQGRPPFAAMEFALIQARLSLEIKNLPPARLTAQMARAR